MEHLLVLHREELSSCFNNIEQRGKDVCKIISRYLLPVLQVIPLSY